jgi:hypothetical protein
MVRSLAGPARPLTGGNCWTWHSLRSFPDLPDPDQTWWVRVFHQGDHCPAPTTRRAHGPMTRFDHHTIHEIPGVPPPPRKCPDGRTIIYLARTMRTALAEVFDDLGTAAVCPGYRIAALHIEEDCRVQDLTGTGCTLLGALPSLCTADLPRGRSQEWARAIAEDQPGGPSIDGVRYTSAHDEGLCLALFERSPALVEVHHGDFPAGGLPLLDIPDRVSTALRAVGVPFRILDAKDCRRCS